MEGTRLGWGWEEALTVDRDLLHPTPATPPWAKKALRTIAVSQVIEFLLYPPPPTTAPRQRGCVCNRKETFPFQCENKFMLSV